MIECYGIIPLQGTQTTTPQVFLIQRTEGFWEFPKGHKEEGESHFAAAERELLEETGFTLSRLLSDEPLFHEYHFTRDNVTFDKRVTFFLAEVKGKIQLQPEEVKDGGWFSFEEARQRLTFESSRLLLDEVAQRV